MGRVSEERRVISKSVDILFADPFALIPSPSFAIHILLFLLRCRQSGCLGLSLPTLLQSDLSFLAHCAHAHALSFAGKIELSATLFVNGLWWCAILVPSDLFAVPEIYLMQMTVSAPKRLTFYLFCWKRIWQTCFLCSFPGK